MIGKPIFNKPRKLPNFHVNPDIKKFESKLSNGQGLKFTQYFNFKLRIKDKQNHVLAKRETISVCESKTSKDSLQNE